MSHFITLYGTAFVFFIIIDFLWIGVIARSFYQKHIGYLLGEFVWPPVIIFYALFILGLTFFVLSPLKDAPLLQVFLTGAFFGLVTYATYDLTNHATVANWPTIVTVVDMCWGAFLGGAVSLCTVYVYRLLFI